MPGVNLILESESAPASSPTDTGKLFVAGATERGSITEPTTVHSPQEFKKRCGLPVAGSYLAVAAEEFFKEGGSTLLVGRALGSGATTASTNLLGSAAGASLVVKAPSPGEYGNKLETKVTAGEGSTFNVLIEEGGVLVEQYSNLPNREAAVSANEQRVAAGTNPAVIISLGTEVDNPVVASAQKLAGGTNGPALKNADYINALGLFHHDLGMGQVAVPGITAQPVQEALLAHGEAQNRTPYVDFPVQEPGESLTLYKGVLESARTALKGLSGARRGAGFSSWVRIPGQAPNTTVLCPYSVVQAGINARNDATATPPPVNRASAGEEGITRNVSSLVSVFSRTERDALNEAGITPVRQMPDGTIETYGVKTFANPETDPAWQQITASRLFMLVIGEGQELLEKAVLKEIDPHGLLFGKVGADLQNFLESLGNQLYNNPAEAVNVGPSVNTKETIAKNEVVADVKVKPTKAAEVVTLRLSAQA
jgi:phage tail sheath protein FI